MRPPWQELAGPAGTLALYVTRDPPRPAVLREAPAPAPGGTFTSPTSSPSPGTPAAPVSGAPPASPARRPVPARTRHRTLVVCHGLPVEPDAASRTGRTFPALADQLARESGWRVATCCLRGVGPSAGDFSIRGWYEDLQAVIEAVRVAPGAPIWVAGFGISGSLALCLAAEDATVRGVMALASPASLAWGTKDPARALALARRVGVVRAARLPTSAKSWASPGSLDPLRAMGAVVPRPVLVVHGADDDVVPIGDARQLVEAGAPHAELRLVAGAGHRLRADPRAVALLLGWLERQGP